MPQLFTRDSQYQVAKPVNVDWNNFRGGLNSLLKETEIKDNELAQANNLKLIGQGVPTKREGTDNYFLTAASVATGSQRVRGLKGVLFASGVSGVNELLSISDAGLLVKKSGASYSIVSGFSYASGYNAEIVQSFNNVYIVNGFNKLTKYNGVSIYPFIGISKPTGLTATNLSGVSGTFQRAFRISAFNGVGETIASDAVLISNTPQDLTDTTIRLNWTTASPASLVAGYAVYGYDQGDERLITTVDPSTLRYDYFGTPEPSNLVFPSAADTTEGPVSKFVISHKDKIVLGNLSGFPSRISWSGGGVNIDKFNWRYGGGYVDIDKDSGDRITGLIEFQDSIVVFKERSIWQVTLAVSGDLVIPTIKMIMRGVGCVSHRTIRYVENDVFFLSRRGVFTIGNEANYVGNVLRTNELSVKIRPIFETLTDSQLASACAVYSDYKYRLAYPSSGNTTNNKEVIYDRERTCWMGPNDYPATPAIYEVYYDGDNKENLIWGDTNDNYVTRFSADYPNDKGKKIETSLRTKKTSLGDDFNYKNIKEVFSNWRNISGSPFVSINLETRTGEKSSGNGFSVSSSKSGTGWGFDKWGTFKWGTTSGSGSGEGSGDIIKRTRVNEISRTVQAEVTTSGTNDKYELLGLRINGTRLGRGYLPTSWNTN
jgi:hypothetical protein